MTNIPHDAILRKIALRLYSFHLEDRTWLLSRLDSGIAERVRSLVAELETLGLEVDLSISEELTEGGEVLIGQVTPSPIGDDSRVFALTSASASQMLDILRDEPEEVCRLVTSLRPWPWLDDFHRLKGARSARLEPMVQPARAVVDSVLTSLSARVTATRVSFQDALEPAEVEPKGGFRKLWTKTVWRAR